MDHIITHYKQKNYIYQTKIFLIFYGGNLSLTLSLLSFYPRVGNLNSLFAYILLFLCTVIIYTINYNTNWSLFSLRCYAWILDDAIFENAFRNKFTS